ncbi:MAG: ATP-binding protein [Deferrisomatales bacterium]|nr:ATP-binding protein [Deferrisomatales bacterium]
MRGDGTDRAGAEAVRRDRDRLHALLDELEVQVADLDARGCYRYVNRSYAEGTGLPREQIVGRSCREVLGGESYSVMAPRLEEARSGGPVCCSVQLPSHGGALCTYEMRLSPVTRDGRGDGLFLVAQDVTGHRRAEEERNLFEERLAQAQRMEALGTLAGGIAHDFNNILGVVMGYTELSLLKLGGATPVRTHLEQVLAAADRAKNVVQQILAFSRASEQRCQPVAVVSLVKEVLKLLRATLPSTIEIIGTLDPGTSQVVADPSQLHQVVMNLCTNAYQAMRDHGGRLEVGLRDVQLSTPGETAEQGYVQLSVVDTGCGMPSQVRERVFEPYFTTRPVGEGTGMGLAVVHGIVTDLGGRVAVASTPGEGTAFQVYLPARVRPQRAAPVEARLPRGTGERILFVDDEAALAHLGAELLGTLGYRVTATTSSLEALELFRADPGGFDCVITDQTLPRITGAELVTRLLRLRPDLPVVLCTGHSDLIDEGGARELGAREFLHKPLELKRLACAVAAALGHRQP